MSDAPIEQPKRPVLDGTRFFGLNADCVDAEGIPGAVVFGKRVTALRPTATDDPYGIGGAK